MNERAGRKRPALFVCVRASATFGVDLGRASTGEGTAWLALLRLVEA